jgi:hypothetical protein
MTGKEIQNNFETWWDKEGTSLRPLPEETAAEHSKRITNLAWVYGANKVKQDVWKRNSRYYNIKP